MIRSTRWLLGSALVACLALAALALLRRHRRRPDLRIEIPDAYWRKEGYTELVPPVRLPTTLQELDDSTVWIKLPAGQKFRTTWLEDQGRYVVTAPPGTVADRVERHGRKVGGHMRWRVVDVRRTRFLENGREIFGVLRPLDADASVLAGFEWPRDDEAAHRRVTDLMLEIIEQQVAPARRAAAAERFRAINECAHCHLHGKRENNSASHPMPRRATDASGLYVVLSVLDERAPLENYRPHDPNADDPLVQIDCAQGALLFVRTDLGTMVRCGDGSVPQGRVDVRAGMDMRDEHALAVCASRRFVFDHLDDDGRRAFSPAFEACGLGGS